MSSVLRLLLWSETAHLRVMTGQDHQLAPRFDLLCMGGATILYLVPYAMLTPQVTVHLTEAGASATAVSIYGLSPFVMVLAMSVVTPKILLRTGLKTAHLLGLVIAALALVATSRLWLAGALTMPFYVALGALLGIASALTWTATEAMIAKHAPADRIGSFTAAYQTGLGASLAIGPFLPVLFSMSDVGIAVTTAILMGFALVLSVGSGRRQTTVGAKTKDGPTGRVAMRAVFVILLVALVGGWFEVGLNAILPYFAVDMGLASGNAAMIVGVLATGALLSQLPIFVLSDKFTTYALYRACALTVTFGAMLLGGASICAHVLWPSAFMFGAGGGALYTLAMIEVARSRVDQPVAALTTLAVSAYTLGAVVGPFSAGVILDLTGARGLWIVLGTVPAVLLLMTFAHPSHQKKET